MRIILVFLINIQFQCSASCLGLGKCLFKNLLLEVVLACLLDGWRRLYSTLCRQMSTQILIVWLRVPSLKTVQGVIQLLGLQRFDVPYDKCGFLFRFASGYTSGLMTTALWSSLERYLLQVRTVLSPDSFWSPIIVSHFFMHTELYCTFLFQLFHLWLHQVSQSMEEGERSALYSTFSILNMSIPFCSYIAMELYWWMIINHAFRLFFMLRRFPIESKGRRKKLHEVCALPVQVEHLIARPSLLRISCTYFQFVVFVYIDCQGHGVQTIKIKPNNSSFQTSSTG